MDPVTAHLTDTVNCTNRQYSHSNLTEAGTMKFGLLYEIEVARPWTETSVSDCFWEILGK